MLKLRAYLAAIGVASCVLAACDGGGGQRHGPVPTPGVDDDEASLLAQLPPLDNPYARKALALRAEVEAANIRDLETLWATLDAILAPMPEPSRIDLVERTRAKLRDDRDVLQPLFIALERDRSGSVPLVTSLRKLVGTGQVTGILDDAVTFWLNQPAANNVFVQRNFTALRPQHNEITVLKTLLIYGNVVARNQDNLETLGSEQHWNDRIQLFYPAALPPGRELEVMRVALFWRLAGAAYLMIPNAGFVFGGNFVASRCRGVDCSAFLSEATYSPRWSTMMLEYTWRELRGEQLSGAEAAQRENLVRQNLLQPLLERYVAVDVSGGEALEPGDIVLWRGALQHTAMYLHRFPSDPPDVFVAIDDTRREDKTFEGVHVRRMQLAQPDSRTYVLRRRL
jgi:hypothetical protein